MCAIAGVSGRKSSGSGRFRIYIRHGYSSRIGESGNRGTGGIGGIGNRRSLVLGPRTWDFGLRISGFGLRTSDFGLRTSDFGLRTSDFGLRISDDLPLLVGIPNDGVPVDHHDGADDLVDR